eukprot:TRINITY_DN2955_c3_g2_i1.p1 TRINITY_DN2955_c3_g2~~TRINITY_DN2955_c3_g2_i1.p1  ORF type:complete len:372 (-),score=108.92 TRINITY_DN2955_c3_g2_i1:40-1155(-)
MTQEKKGINVKMALAITGMMIFGTGTMVSSKMQMQMKAFGRNHHRHFFEKPWFQSTSMFLSMSISMIVYFIDKAMSKSDSKKITPLINGSQESQESEKNNSAFFLIGVPALFDLLATTLMSFGLIFINVSIMQMLRGSMTIFSAILSIIFLKKSLKKHEWFGILLVFIALLMVGSSSVIGAMVSNVGGQRPWEQQLLGVILVVCSQFVQACQIVVEEHLLSNFNASPFLVVGMEGVWGFILCCCFFLPMAQFFRNEAFGEDSVDTFMMLSVSKEIKIAVAVYLVSILMLNISGMVVTQQSSAVFRTIMESLRTLAIWVTNLFIFYVFPNSGFGEDWNTWSYLQLAGFVLLFLATLINKGMYEVPGFHYKKE